MCKNKNAEFCGTPEKRPIPCVGELRVLNRGANFYCLKTIGRNNPFEFGDGRIGILHWDGRHRTEAIRVRGHEFGDTVVDKPRYLRALLGICPIIEEGRGWREHRDVKAFAVHRPKFFLRIRELVEERIRESLLMDHVFGVISILYMSGEDRRIGCYGLDYVRWNYMAMYVD